MQKMDTREPVLKNLPHGLMCTPCLRRVWCEDVVNGSIEAQGSFSVGQGQKLAVAGLVHFSDSLNDMFFLLKRILSNEKFSLWHLEGFCVVRIDQCT